MKTSTRFFNRLVLLANLEIDRTNIQWLVVGWRVNLGTVNTVINQNTFCETNKIGSMNKSEGSAWNNFCGILFLDRRNFY